MTSVLVNTTSIFPQNNLTVPEGCIIVDTSTKTFIPWNNPDNIISHETERTADFAIGSICLPVLFLTSVPCNLLNMLVFWKQGLKERINICLFCLSLVDFLHMLNSFVLNVDRLYPPFNQVGGPVREFFITHRLMGLRGMLWLSGFISMLIACERCLCVVSPLRSQTLLSSRTTTATLAVAAVLILTPAMLIGLRWGLVCAFHPQTGRTSQVIYPSTFYMQNKAHLDTLTLFTGTLQPFLFAVVVFATTVVTSVKLKEMMTWREQTSSSKLSTRDVALTRMLIAISVLYVICSVPTVFTGMAIMFVADVNVGGRYENLFKLLINSIELASYFNATLNFFVYCFLGSRYKETIRKVLRFKK